jgi:hypothetical protein
MAMAEHLNDNIAEAGNAGTLDLARWRPAIITNSSIFTRLELGVARYRLYAVFLFASDTSNLSFFLVWQSFVCIVPLPVDIQVR